MKKLSRNQIKTIVITLMTMGHIGYFFGKETIWGTTLDVISQITGLTMAFFLFQGFFYTHSLKRYIYRLLICGIIAQIWLFLLRETRLNICCSFILCLGILSCLNKHNMHTAVKIILIVILFAVSLLCEGRCLYPIFVTLLYFNRVGHIKQITAFVGASLFSFFYNMSAVVYFSYKRNIVYYREGIECLLVFSVHMLSYFLIRYCYNSDEYYNDRKYRFYKYFFYIYYPLQFFVLYVLD